MKRWLKRAYRHHAQSRELERSEDLNGEADVAQGPLQPRVAAGRSAPRALVLRHQHAVKQAFQLAGPLGKLAVA